MDINEQINDSIPSTEFPMVCAIDVSKAVAEMTGYVWGFDN